MGVEGVTKATLPHLALALAARAGAVVDAIKKHEFHGHPLDTDALEAMLNEVVGAVDVLQEALDALPIPDPAQRVTRNDPPVGVQLLQDAQGLGGEGVEGVE